jgi:uncharacterized membrane protein YcaP (DUF421 family)
MPPLIQQVLMALGYYAGLIVLVRLSGKRHAGPTTPFDLIVLITIAVVLQQTALLPGALNALVFAVTVFGAHAGMTQLCVRSSALRRLLRGAPRPVVRHGQVSFEALEAERLSYEELLAGLRKLGHVGPETVRLATLEETGHISVIPMPSVAAAARERPAPPHAPPRPTQRSGDDGRFDLD